MKGRFNYMEEDWKNEKYRNAKCLRRLKAESYTQEMSHKFNEENIISNRDESIFMKGKFQFIIVK